MSGAMVPFTAAELADLDAPRFETPPVGLPAVSARDLLAEAPPDIEWLVDGLIPAAGVAVLAGDPKSFKTLLALQLAVTISYFPDDFDTRELTFLGRPATAGTVLFVEEEGSRHKLRERLEMMSRGLGYTEPPAISFVLHHGVRLDHKASLTELWRTVQAQEPALVVLDPLVMLHDGDENKAGDMGRLMRGLVGIAAKAQTCVLIVHHVNKPSAERRVTRAAQRLRGSSAFAGATDANLILDRDGDYTARLRGEFRDGEPVDAYLELDPTTLLLRAIDAPSKDGKVPAAELRAFVEETGQVSARAVMERFGCSRNTAKEALDRIPGLDTFEDPRLGRVWFLRGEEQDAA